MSSNSVEKRFASKRQRITKLFKSFGLSLKLKALEYLDDYQSQIFGQQQPNSSSPSIDIEFDKLFEKIISLILKISTTECIIDSQVVQKVLATMLPSCKPTDCSSSSNSKIIGVDVLENIGPKTKKKDLRPSFVLNDYCIEDSGLLQKTIDSNKKLYMQHAQLILDQIRLHMKLYDSEKTQEDPEHEISTIYGHLIPASSMGRGKKQSRPSFILSCCAKVTKESQSLADVQLMRNFERFQLKFDEDQCEIDELIAPGCFVECVGKIVDSSLQYEVANANGKAVVAELPIFHCRTIRDPLRHRLTFIDSIPHDQPTEIAIFSAVNLSDLICLSKFQSALNLIAKSPQQNADVHDFVASTIPAVVCLGPFIGNMRNEKNNQENYISDYEKIFKIIRNLSNQYHESLQFLFVPSSQDRDALETFPRLKLLNSFLNDQELGSLNASCLLGPNPCIASSDDRHILSATCTSNFSKLYRNSLKQTQDTDVNIDAFLKSFITQCTFSPGLSYSSCPMLTCLQGGILRRPSIGKKKLSHGRDSASSISDLLIVSMCDSDAIVRDKSHSSAIRQLHCYETGQRIILGVPFEQQNDALQPGVNSKAAKRNFRYILYSTISKDFYLQVV